MTTHFRLALESEIPQIWSILQQAIERRKIDGSNQWQNGYPNQESIRQDITKNVGYVLTEGEQVIAYGAVLINDEPAYADIIGKWLTNDDFVVVHRVAISETHLGKGLIQKMFAYIEDFARKNKIYSIKVDTNFDNQAMLRIMEKLEYSYCGEVSMGGSPRKAFEKVLEE